MKNIIVVADKDLKSIGRELVHAMSKTKIAQASLFTPKQYEDNEHQLAGTQYVIFLGKNDVSKDFIPLIQKKYEKYGVVWGYDASKAFIYLEASDVSLTDLRNEIIQLKAEIKKANESLIFIHGFLDVLFLLYPWADPIYLVSYLIKRKKQIKEAKKLQIKLGIITFLKDGFDKFVKVDLA